MTGPQSSGPSNDRDRQNRVRASAGDQDHHRDELAHDGCTLLTGNVKALPACPRCSLHWRMVSAHRKTISNGIQRKSGARPQCRAKKISIQKKANSATASTDKQEGHR